MSDYKLAEFGGHGALPYKEAGIKPDVHSLMYQVRQLQSQLTASKARAAELEQALLDAMTEIDQLRGEQ